VGIFVGYNENWDRRRGFALVRHLLTKSLDAGLAVWASAVAEQAARERAPQSAVASERLAGTMLQQLGITGGFSSCFVGATLFAQVIER
jgi:hypothetical protein